MYKIFYAKEAVSAIKKLSAKKQRQVKDAIERIAENPDIGKRLTHELKGLSSYRSGNYRIIYRTNRKEIYVMVLTVGHRKDVYTQIKRIV